MSMTISSARRGPFAWTANALLAAILAAGGPGSGLAWAASPAPAEAGSALSVTTDPSGAGVFVDGQFQGDTPLNLASLAAGDHRVTVVKDGYLENSRLVRVGRGASRDLQVKLTPQARTTTRPRLQVDDEKEKEGGGSKKKLWIGIAAGAALLGAGAYFLLRNTNDPPRVTGVTASPTAGLAGVTSIQFTAAGATDPDGDALTYTWNFGDGGSGSGATATAAHTYTTAGTFNVTVTVSDGKASATASGSVTIKALSGNWGGTLNCSGCISFSMSLTQSGTSVSGTYSDSINGTFPTNGNVESPRNVNLTSITPAGFLNIVWTGTFSDDTFDRIQGTVTGYTGGSLGFTLTRR